MTHPITAKTVHYNSDEAAKWESKTVEGWWSRTGRYFGIDKGAEATARYDGCTHRSCQDCGAVVERSYTLCGYCRDNKSMAKFRATPGKVWDEKSPIGFFNDDQLFFDLDSVYDHAADMAEIELSEDEVSDSVDALPLAVCKPNRPWEINVGEIYCDIAPDNMDSWDLHPMIEAAAEALNKAIREHNDPISWEVSRTPAVLPHELITASAILQDGKIYTGHRHHNVIKDMVEICNIKQPINGEQGFITTRGIFLTRQEALKLAKLNGQLEGRVKTHPPDTLFSEDLW